VVFAVVAFSAHRLSLGLRVSCLSAGPILLSSEAAGALAALVFAAQSLSVAALVAVLVSLAQAQALVRFLSTPSPF